MSADKNIQVTVVNNRPLIFTKVRHNSRSEQVISMIANAIGWIIWLYFWKVLLISLAWYLGLRLAYDEWIVYGGWKALTTFAEETAPYGLALCAVLWLWALQDIWRFRKELRRKDVDYPSVKKDCLWTSVDPEVLQNARTHKILACQHDAHGQLIAISDQL
ncbi:poly-beta-1,6-N-acetyl-D-glucosamine biosynthesis protein PgaD [Polynucleobacter paneuropaeus]|nr:poly-beta-1,6-N-acetyl-D-glucosamine biosynthesis protein PgaD [Polynucleobacter paneuropaeus]